MVLLCPTVVLADPVFQSDLVDPSDLVGLADRAQGRMALDPRRICLTISMNNPGFLPHRGYRSVPNYAEY